MEKMVSGDDLVNTSPVSVVNVFKSSKLLFFVITFCAYSRAFSPVLHVQVNAAFQ